MAQRVRVHVEDDIDGSPAEETVTFGLDGRAFEIDLSAKNAAKLRTALAVYVKAGRRAGRASAAGLSPRGPQHTYDVDAAIIRSWAHEQGHEVNSRGRVSVTLREAYAAAH
jgi:hypothetical protein